MANLKTEICDFKFLAERGQGTGPLPSIRRACTYITEHVMTGRQVELVLAGSLINLMRERHSQ